MTEFEFDVALSFAGEDRAYVERVAAALKRENVRVFYDVDEETALWGLDLGVHLDEVYRTKARFVVVFVSRYYAEKYVPQHEFRSALAAAMRKKGAFLLPVRLDDTQMPGLNPNIVYLDGRKLTPEEVAERTRAKLDKPNDGVRPSSDASSRVRLPKVRPAQFNQFAEAERMLEIIREGLTARLPQLQEHGLVIHPTMRDGRFAIKVLHDGDTVYTFETWIEDSGDSLAFYDGQGGHYSRGSMTATGSVDWDRERGEVVLKLINFSLINHTHEVERPSAGELLEAIWNSMVEKIEQRVG